jgi:hypothetical protein
MSTSHRIPLGISISVAAALSGSALHAQTRFATSVVSYNQGGGSGVFDTSNILGGPRGGGFSSGSLHVLTLGNAGDATLAFDVVLTDGPGADFSVFENGFEFSGGVFAEVCFVEVSTNGADFARFPTRYGGAPGPHGEFAALPYATFAGLSGGAPVRANVVTNSIDPFDPVVSGGESFDLADLENDPLVQSGLVDLAQIHYVRLVDLVAGQHGDSNGVTIWDSGGTSSADMDAVAVIQHTGNQAPSGPSVDFHFDSAGYLILVVTDPDGLGDITSAGSIAASVNLQSVPIKRLFNFFRLEARTPTLVRLKSRFSLQGGAPRLLIAVSATDSTGAFSADQAVVH